MAYQKKNMRINDTRVIPKKIGVSLLADFLLSNVDSFIIYYHRTTEIRDFERSEEIPLQLMVMYLFIFR